MSWHSPHAGPLLCPSEERAEASNVGSGKLGWAFHKPTPLADGPGLSRQFLVPEHHVAP